MWVISEFIKAKIDFQKCPIGVIPFGTGNDFSRTMQWGGSAPGDLSKTGIIALANKWVKAQILDFQIWEIEIKGDKFEKVKNKAI